jgi:hypothetical protein
VFVCVLPALAPGIQDAIGDHVHGGIEVELLSFGAVRRRVEHRALPLRTGDELFAGRTLRHSPPRETGLSGLPSIWMTCSSLT